MGHVSEQEWMSGPTHRPHLCPFVSVYDITPSRFVLAYEDNFDVGFIALDPERVGDMADDGWMTDLGDNKTRYKKSNEYINSCNDDNSIVVDDDDDDDDDDEYDDDYDDDDAKHNDDSSSSSSNNIISASLRTFLSMTNL